MYFFFFFCRLVNSRAKLDNIMANLTPPDNAIKHMKVFVQKNVLSVTLTKMYDNYETSLDGNI